MGQAIRHTAHTVVYVQAVAVFAFVVFATGACGRKFEKHPMAVGQTMVLKPTPIVVAPARETKPANIRIIVDIGGKMMEAEDDVEIAFYAKAGDEKPLRTFTPKQMLNTYKETDCSKEALQFLENAMLGDSLFCNKSLDLDKVGAFVARRPGKDDKTASQPLLEYEDVALGFASYTLTFY